MIVIPAIDLKDGRCVRLRQGRMQDETVYSPEPAEVARRWADEGAQILHVVDLNGAVEGSPRNRAAIESILKAVAIPVQVGGGIRTLEESYEAFSRREFNSARILSQPLDVALQGLISFAQTLYLRFDPLPLS